jgi:hypothetical protein
VRRALETSVALKLSGSGSPATVFTSVSAGPASVGGVSVGGYVGGGEVGGGVVGGG